MSAEVATPQQSSALVLGGIVPYLSVDGAAKAAAFYEKAFGAKVVAQHPVDDQGRTMHIHLHINGGSVMLADFYPEHGHGFEAPSAFNLHIQVDDVEPLWNRAVAAGAEIVLPLQIMFWGDNYGIVKDPFGVRWSLASTPK